MFGLFKKRRRKKLAATPLPEAWLQIIGRNVPLYSRLPENDRRELEGHVQVFLAEKTFEGCGGLEITDEIRVTVAAQACVLLLHRETDYYPHVTSILVYPTAYSAPLKEHVGSFVVTEGREGRLGEAWMHGAVVLSWEDVRFGASDVRDGHNLVLHEFAHQLDMEDNSADGAPILPRRSMYVAWARVLGREFKRLQIDADHDRATVLDKYGATSPAEFFAVATECFFERPDRLKRAHPALYHQLKALYCQDPMDYLKRTPDEEGR